MAFKQHTVAKTHDDWWQTVVLADADSTKKYFHVVQITDCHLYAEPDGEYHGANCYQHFLSACQHIAHYEPDLVILTGDVTNDHTEGSYQRVAEVIRTTLSNVTVAWLPGNHDEIDLMQQYFSGQPFIQSKHIQLGLWQLFLMNSKSDTPAGYVEPTHLAALEQLQQTTLSKAPYAGAFMHHHPFPMNAYIDKHICENGDDVIAALKSDTSWRFLAHGHVHCERSLSLDKLQLFATPATSVQFGQSQEWQQINSGPAYRIFTLYASGQLETDVVSLPAVIAEA